MTLYPERMEWVEIYLMKGDLHRVTTELQEARLIHPMSVSGSKDMRLNPSLLERRARLDRILDLLAPMEEAVKGLKALTVKKTLFSVPEGSSLRAVDSWLGSIEAKLEPFERELREKEESLERLDEIKGRLIPLSGLDLDLVTYSSFRRTRVRVGTTRRFQELRDLVEGLGGNIQGSLLDRKEGLHSVMIAYPSSCEGRMKERLKGRLFSEVVIDVSSLRELLEGTGHDVDMLNLPISGLIMELESVRDSIDTSLSSLRKEGSNLASDILPAARAYGEILEIELERSRFSGTLERTRYTSIIIGWIPKRRLRPLKDVLDKRAPGRYHLDHRGPTPDEIGKNKVPTSLRNGWLGTMFEPLTNTFAIPRYDEIDPSLWISVPFILFFGLMLGDAGYGLLIMIASSVMLVLSRYSPALRMTAWMGFLLGLATTLSGIWMGAFFGDLIPRVIMGRPASPLFSVTFFGYHMPYDTLSDPMLLFKVSLYLGLAQLNLGIFLFGIDRLLKKDIMGFVKGTISWMLIQFGAVIFVGALLIGWWELDGTLTAVGGVSFILGSVLLALESKGMVLFDIEGYLGDWISYTRILALGLSTFGLAMAFNIVGRMLMDINVVMIPFVVLLLVLLHVFNLLLQSLGAAVHSLRLQFVEFFGRFYEGGGIPYEPFGIERIFTKKVPQKRGSRRNEDVS
ncbi:MAG: hypothetical protein DRN57_02590 [Thermoplasmata archaeon]|nr:MAG: hypothetical protein DRN57_02590 [Thermoplasmata archaeon]